MEINASELMTEEELKNSEIEGKSPEASTVGYDRSLYCVDPNRIKELVDNIFVPAQQMADNPEELFYECSEDAIKWATSKMNHIQLIIVEGLLSHRLSTGMLKGVYEDNLESPFRAFPGNSPFLQGTVFLGGIKDEKQYNFILNNVVRMANIPIENNDKIACFKECLNPNMPQAEGLVMVLIGLDENEMANLKRSSRVRKASDKVKKFTEQANTVGVGFTKAVVDDIANPLMETAGKLGGVVAAGAVNGTFKSATTFANEVVTGVVKADLGNYPPLQELKVNSRKLIGTIFKQKTTDSYNFSF